MDQYTNKALRFVSVLSMGYEKGNSYNLIPINQNEQNVVEVDVTSVMVCGDLLTSDDWKPLCSIFLAMFGKKIEPNMPISYLFCIAVTAIVCRDIKTLLLCSRKNDNEILTSRLPYTIPPYYSTREGKDALIAKLSASKPLFMYVDIQKPLEESLIRAVDFINSMSLYTFNFVAYVANSAYIEMEICKNAEDVYKDLGEGSTLQTAGDRAQYLEKHLKNLDSIHQQYTSKENIKDFVGNIIIETKIAHSNINKLYLQADALQHMVNDLQCKIDKMKGELEKLLNEKSNKPVPNTPQVSKYATWHPYRK